VRAPRPLSLREDLPSCADRGTGFESKLFQRMNQRKRSGLESYQWGAEDM
jgi:hypothetical protein